MDTDNDTGTGLQPLPAGGIGIALIELAPERVADLIFAGHVRLPDVVDQLLAAEPTEARALMVALPPLVQGHMLHTELGGSSGAGMTSSSAEESALLPLMAPQVACDALAVDTMCFTALTDVGLMMRGFLSAQEFGTELGDAERERRMVSVTSASGKPVHIPVVVDVARALVYLLSVVRSTDEAWKEEMCDLLGPEFLALILASCEQGVIDIEYDVRVELSQLAPDGYWDEGYGMARSRRWDPEPIEADLIERHITAMKAAFNLEAVDLEGADERADDLLAGLV